jgi:hypothetical protein
MDLSDASEKIPSDTTGDRSGDLPTSSAAGWIHTTYNKSYSCISIRFLFVICNLAHDLKMAKHGRKNVVIVYPIKCRILRHLCSDRPSFPLFMHTNTTGMMSMKISSAFYYCSFQGPTVLCSAFSQTLRVYFLPQIRKAQLYASVLYRFV